MGVNEIVINIKNIFFTTKVIQIKALSRYYASLALQYFLQLQPPGIGKRGRWWVNQSAQAALRMFTQAFEDDYDFGWFIAHGVDYGVYLTLANNREHDALTFVTRRFAGQYFKDIERLLTA